MLEGVTLGSEHIELSVLSVHTDVLSVKKKSYETVEAGLAPKVNAPPDNSDTDRAVEVVNGKYISS